MEQIIGVHKEFIVLERKVLEVIEQSAKQKLENNKERPLSESSIEARSVLSVVEWVKENNIYNKDFKFKK
jgi:hypothetical protein